MSYPKFTRKWVLASRPDGMPVVSGSGEQTFRLVTNPIPPLKENQALVRMLYFSNDPVYRVWIAKNVKRLYVPTVNVNEVMPTQGIAEVVESTSIALNPGMRIFCSSGWTEFAVVDANGLMPLADLPPGLDVTQYLGALGPTGFTAYYGIKVVAEAKPEDVVVVSAAAGATGSMAIQIAKKMIGCRRVIGIAGGEKKCRWVEDHLGADVCVDYKSASFVDDLEKATGGENPDVSVYFDNVGGEILDAMLTRLATFGRVAACGTVSNYNASPDRVTGVKNWFEIISMRLQIRGFLVSDYYDKEKREEMIEYLLEGHRAGKLKIGDESQYIVGVKFEDVPKVWVKLFEGGNTGKLVTKLEG